MMLKAFAAIGILWLIILAWRQLMRLRLFVIRCNNIWKFHEHMEKQVRYVSGELGDLRIRIEKLERVTHGK